MVTETVTSGTDSTPGSRDRREEDGVTDLKSGRGWGPGIQTSEEVPVLVPQALGGRAQG